MNKHFTLVVFYIFFLAFSLQSQDDVKELFDQSWDIKDTVEKRRLRERIIKLSPASEYGLFSRAYLFYLAEDNTTAIELYSQAINKNSIFWQAYFNRGVAYDDLKKYDEAISDYSKSISINPNFAKNYNRRGYDYYFKEKYDEAISDFTKAIIINPNDDYAYYFRGLSFYSKKKYNEAVSDLTKAISIDPTEVNAYYFRGKAFFELKKDNEAISDFTKSITMNPNDEAAYYYRGNVYDILNRYDEAISDYTKAISINPNYAQYYISDFTKSITMNPNDEAAYYYRGNVYYILNRYDEAIYDYTKAISINPNYAQYYISRGDAFNSINKYDEANSDYSKANTLNPNIIVRKSFSQVTDKDGNTYKTVTIGEQEWMAENLNVSKYRNGDEIPQVQGADDWSKLTTGAWCYYENETKNGKIYGKLYNWYAVNDSRSLAPEGWHIPSDEEWTKLTDNLGGILAGGIKYYYIESVGCKLKTKTLWNNPNEGATNESGFTAFPGGDRGIYGDYGYIGKYGYFWSASEVSNVAAWSRYLISVSSGVYLGSFDKDFGFSIRCVKD